MTKKKKIFIIVLILALIIGSIFGYIKIKNKPIVFNNFMEFEPKSYKEETFVYFISDGKGETEGIQVNKEGKVLKKYLIEMSLSPMISFSEQKGNNEEVFIETTYFDTNEIYKYNFNENKFSKEALPLDEKYLIYSDAFYSDNVLTIITDGENNYFYDMSNDKMYSPIPYRLAKSEYIEDVENSQYIYSRPSYTKIVENSEYIYYMDKDNIPFEYNKITNEYKRYDDYFKRFYNFFIPLDDSVVVMPEGETSFYQIKDGELNYLFDVGSELKNKSGLQDVYYLDNSKVLFSFVNGDAYFINLIDEKINKITEGDNVYEVMYADDKYLYISDVSAFNEEKDYATILLFDKFTKRISDTIEIKIDTEKYKSTDGFVFIRVY